MGHPALRNTAIAVLAAVMTASVATGASAAPADPALPFAAGAPQGVYIVVLDDEPVSLYAGGRSEYIATKPDRGASLDTRAPAARKYASFLEKQQEKVAAALDVTPLATYRTALNGFSVTLTPEQAMAASVADGVRAVYADEFRHLDAATALDGLDGEGGVWDEVGGVAEAGRGIVVGVVDTGVAPGNPSFAGDALEPGSRPTPSITDPGTRAPGSAPPYLDTALDEIVYAKADGTTFRSAYDAANDWALDDFSTKIIGARAFGAGAAAAGVDLSYDAVSPRDSAGHGSHVAGTAAGATGVAATANGVALGKISGVAPAAKLAVYKACFAGDDPLVTSDEVCVLSDVLAAVDAAVADGVDVLAYPLSGAASEIEDEALRGAASAGVFVSVSAGNAGQDAAGTLRDAPWYTTVAASTTSAWEGTVRVGDEFEAVGASVTVPGGKGVTGRVVYGGDAAEDPADEVAASLCYLDSLDIAKVSGRIVVCDRGTNDLAEKSREVAAKRGIGMILVNPTPGSVDELLHSVPTVHLDAAARDALLKAVRGSARATATLTAGNDTEHQTAAPQIAPFSSRGPTLDDGLGPDVTAPGVGILAPTANEPGTAPAFGIMSGTSMAAAHVAGLAALVLGERPTASPSQLASALATTAHDTVNAAGGRFTDPFAQGAGRVDAAGVLDPGLVYGEPGASIAVPALSTPASVTRTLTALRPGVYEVEASLPGVDVVVSPTELTFARAGETKTFRVTLASTTAPVEKWATGFITWTNADDGTTVRAPLAARPVTVDAPAGTVGRGMASSVDIEIVPTVTGTIPLHISGFGEVERLVDPARDDAPHTGDETSGIVSWPVTVRAGTTLARWALSSTGGDVALHVYRLGAGGAYLEHWSSASEVSLLDPEPGRYLVVALPAATDDEYTWDVTSALVTRDGAGTIVTDRIEPTQRVPVTYSLRWSGLRADAQYLAVVRYGDSDVRTIVRVDTGAAPPRSVEKPVLSGEGAIGETLTTDAGTWDVDDSTVAYQWLRDGEPIPGAELSTYDIRPSDVGSTLWARVTARVPGSINVGIAETKSVFVKHPSTTAVSLDAYVGDAAHEWAVDVAVTAADGSAAVGTVTVFVDGQTYTGTLADGRVGFVLARQTAGPHVVVATYSGSDRVAGSTGISAFLVSQSVP